jgi:hypothetical protein
MQEVEVDNAPKLYWFELFFCNSLYLLVYTLTLRVGIILGQTALKEGRLVIIRIIMSVITEVTTQIIRHIYNSPNTSFITIDSCLHQSN